MRLSPPKQITWYIALILVILAIIGMLTTVPVISEYAVWLAIASGVLLLIATTTKGM